MKSRALFTRIAVLTAAFAPAAAQAHGSEILMLGVAQLLLGAAAAAVLIPTRISLGRKVGVLFAFAAGIPVGWGVMTLLPATMFSVFVVPLLVPLCFLALALIVTRRRANAQRA